MQKFKNALSEAVAEQSAEGLNVQLFIRSAVFMVACFLAGAIFYSFSWGIYEAFGCLAAGALTAVYFWSKFYAWL